MYDAHREFSKETLQELPSKLKQARITAKLSQKELAREMDCSASAVGLYETGVRKPGLDYLIRFCLNTHTNLLWLLNFNDKQRLSELEYETTNNKKEEIIKIVKETNDIDLINALYVLAVRRSTRVWLPSEEES